MNRKISIRGKAFLQSIKPVTTLAGWVTFVSAIFWAFTHQYSFLKGILFVFGVQMVMGLLAIATLGLIVTYKEKRWEKES